MTTPSTKWTQDVPLETKYGKAQPEGEDYALLFYSYI